MKKLLLLFLFSANANAVILTTCDATHSLAVTAMQSRQAGVAWSMMQGVGKEGTVTERILRSAYKFPIQPTVEGQQYFVHSFAKDWRNICLQLQELGESL